jgi:hypothetical protein
MKKIAIFGAMAMYFILGLNPNVGAQELSCTVDINTSEIKKNELGSNLQVFEDVRTFITEFMNNRRWTNDQYENFEKINCDLRISITSADLKGNFKGVATFLVKRPIYGSNYETNLLRYLDRNFNFEFQSNTPMNYNENAYSNKLTHLLAYYAHLALAIDNDSFSKHGGSNNINKMQQLVGQVPFENSTGWSSKDGDFRNKYYLAENLLNQQMLPLREAHYNYHRKGMDMFATDAGAARKNAINYLSKMKEILLQRPNAILINCILEAKYEEFINMFEPAQTAEKQKVYKLLTGLDPARTEKYNKLLE